MSGNEGMIGFDVDLVAERPLVAETRFEEEGGIGVDWRGSCWAWLKDDAAPVLMEVVVNDGKTARLLFPGQVRRVRAMVRAVESPEGRVEELNVLADLGWEARTVPCAAIRGLYEGGRVRVGGQALPSEIAGKTGQLIRYTTATVEVDGRRYSVSVKELEPIGGGKGPEPVAEVEAAGDRS